MASTQAWNSASLSPFFETLPKTSLREQNPPSAV
jgi:hypothetical protein